MNIYSKNPLSFSITASNLENRLDVQFYHPDHYALETQLENSPYPVMELTTISEKIVDGPFGSQLKVDEYVETGIPLVRVSDLSTDSLNDDGLAFITPEKQEEISRSRVLPGDVLVTKAGSLGYSTVFPERWPEGNITSHLALIRCKDMIRNRYLSIYLRSELGISQIYRWGNKTTRPELNLQEVSQIKVVVPPLEIQEKIVEIIKKSVEESENKKKKAEDLLNKIDPVLYAELGIKPVRKKRNELYFSIMSDRVQTDRFDPYYYSPIFSAMEKSLKNSKYPLMKFEDIFSYIRNGIDQREYAKEGIPYVRVSDIDKEKIKYSDIKKLDRSEFNPDRAIDIHEGDILFTRKGSYGITAVVLENDTDVQISSEIILLRLDEDVDVLPKFVSIFNNSNIGQLQCKRGAVGTIIPGINHTNLKQFFIPVPPLSKQKEIVMKIMSLYEKIRKLKEEANTVKEEALNRATKIILGHE